MDGHQFVLHWIPDYLVSNEQGLWSLSSRNHYDFGTYDDSFDELYLSKETTIPELRTFVASQIVCNFYLEARIEVITYLGVDYQEPIFFVYCQQ